jgi:hypothetical protein
MDYSGADVARFLGITTSAVNRLAVSDELPEVAKQVYVAPPYNERRKTWLFGT